MDTHTQPHPTYAPQILTIDVNLVPVDDTRLDLYCRRFERLERGWQLQLTAAEQGCKVRFRVHTQFAADVPYRLHSLKIREEGATTVAITDGPTYTLPLLQAGAELLLLDLIAEPQGDPGKPKRRGGGNLIIRDAGGSN